ncbi:hypothetical protein [Rhizobium sp. F40D2]|uniref:hypothetical protein n=1 Tax=Rhizobium sp. F40D2 TaxID=3453141 RepID=UPI003F26AD1D
MRDDFIQAHTQSSNHRREIDASASCGCFHCCAVFKPAEIEEWVTMTVQLCARAAALTL